VAPNAQQGVLDRVGVDHHNIESTFGVLNEREKLIENEYEEVTEVGLDGDVAPHGGHGPDEFGHAL